MIAIILVLGRLVRLAFDRVVSLPDEGTIRRRSPGRSPLLGSASDPLRTSRITVRLLPLNIGSGVLSRRRRQLIWGGVLLLGGLGGTAHSLLTYRGAELRTYLMTYAVVLVGFLVVALSEWLRRRRTKRE